MYRSHFPNRFQFYNNSVLNNQISDELTYNNPVIINYQRFLTINSQVIIAQLM